MFEAARALQEFGFNPDLLYLGNLRSPLGIARARKLVRTRSTAYDIVHSQFGSACAVATQSCRSALKVVSLRGSDWTPAYSSNPVWMAHGQVATWLTRRSLPSYDLAICVSHRIEHEVRKRFPALPTIVQADPIDLGKFKPMPKSDARRALGLPDSGEKYVLFTARNRGAQHKRIELAEAAIHFAQRACPELRILVASGYSHAQMPTLAAAADVAICTSIAEGWPNSMKEALACGVPFVATDVSDLATIAREDPSCHVVSPTPEALGTALVAVLGMAEVGNLRRHLASMSMDAFARKMLDAYQGLLERR